MNPVNEHVALDFVYCGKRLLTDGKYGISIMTINDGLLGREALYDYSNKRNYVIGGVYQGASFSEGGAKGLDGASYLNRWDDKSLIVLWTAKNDEAEINFKRNKLEKDAKKVHIIEEMLLPIRTEYEKLKKNRDYGGMRALELAVMRAITISPRSKENVEN